jgi:methionyl-tRNA formyltransferase
VKKIVFMGTPDYATEILKKLLESKYEVVALYTQPDKPVGRKQVLTPPHIKQYCIDNNIDLPVHQPLKLRDDNVVSEIKNYHPDFIVVAAYGQILPKSILDIAPCINLHASLLPKYRGASPIQQSLLNDDKYTGVTSMLMDVGLDSGDVLGLKYLKVPKDMVVAELFDSLSAIAADLTIETLNNFEFIDPKSQTLNQVSHCGKVNKSNGLVDFSSSYDLYKKYRAYKTWPDVYLDSGLKIKECKLVSKCTLNTAGEIIDIQKDFVTIGCAKGTLEISQVQPQSKKQMNVVDYIRGKRLEIGDILV